MGIIGGYGGIVVLDIDNNDISKNLKINTFTVKTGNDGKHFYFMSDYKTNHVFKDGIGELRSNNYQVVISGSTHPNGNKYEIHRDTNIIKLDSKELSEIIKPYLRDRSTTQQTNTGDTSRSAVEFREVIKLVRQGKSFQEINERMINFSKWSTSSTAYKEMTYGKVVVYVQGKKQAKEEKEKQLINADTLSLLLPNKEMLAQRFFEVQPYFYNSSLGFFFWNGTNYEPVDDYFIMSKLKKCSQEQNVSVVEGKFWTECMRAMKLIGSQKKPKDFEKTWIQFGDTVHDYKTKESWKATPEYFSVNVKPYEPSENADTPETDKLFTEWVGEEKLSDLYEVLALCVVDYYLLQRIIFLVGTGSNGKGRFRALIEKFVGKENCTTSEVSLLSDEKQRFETVTLLHKDVCFLGEMSVESIKSSKRLKDSCGNEPLRMEMKGHKGSSFENYALLIGAANELPIVPDVSDGWHRRPKVILFPNKFPEGKEPLDRIPESEYNSLSRKVLNILPKLSEAGKFSTDDGEIAERKKIYESYSNPVMGFVSKFYNRDVLGESDYLFFLKEFMEWHRQKGGKLLPERNIKKMITAAGLSMERKSVRLDDLIQKLLVVRGIMIK